MKKDELEIIDKKNIDTLVEELQFLSSDILPKLNKINGLTIHIDNIMKTIGTSYKQSVITYNRTNEIDKTLQRLEKVVKNVIQNTADSIDTKRLEQSLLNTMHVDNKKVLIYMKKLENELMEQLDSSIITAKNFYTQTQNIDELKTELKYNRWIGGFLLVAVVWLLVKI